MVAFSVFHVKRSDGEERTKEEGDEGRVEG